jgi:protocatechuate 3,4-dioxygenase beta subunit
VLNDDSPVGRLLTRREAVALLGFAAPAATTAHAFGLQASPPAGADVLPCVVQPEQIEGPYFVDAKLNRSDVRTDPGTGAARPGVPLHLTFRVSRVGGDRSCTPLPGAHIDVWQCDANGVYSGVQDPGFNTMGQNFLRGFQVTDARGEARFTTIYPGSYPGRPVHVHFKVRTRPGEGRGHEFTSQLYFDDALSDRVLAREPYAAADGGRRTRNEDDRFFRQGGEQLVLALREDGSGFTGEFALALKV